MPRYHSDDGGRRDRKSYRHFGRGNRSELAVEEMPGEASSEKGWLFGTTRVLSS
jgi:hypothetical protein